jgi:hypothetical protein
VVFWAVTPCSLVDEYQCFRGTYSLHLQDQSKYGEDMVKVIYAGRKWSLRRTGGVQPRLDQYPMKAYWGVRVYIHDFLTSALVGGEWSTSRLGRFTPGERAPSSHWIGGWWAPEPVWTLWSREISYNAGIRTRAVQPIAIPTEVSRLPSRNGEQEEW